MLNQIDSFILHLATERGHSDNYQLIVRRTLERFAAWVAEDRNVSAANQVTTLDLTDYLMHRKRSGLASSSIRLELVALKIFFRWLNARRMREGDPAEAILPPRTDLRRGQHQHRLQRGSGRVRADTVGSCGPGRPPWRRAVP